MSNRAVAYLRTSTKGQRLSLPVQRSAIAAWAQSEGVTVVAWHVDAGVSGAKSLASRPALSAALVSLRTFGATTLAVAHRDRLARNAVVAAAIDSDVRDAGASVVSCDPTANAAADEFTRRVQDAHAEYARTLTRTRTKAALAVKSARGERVGGRVRYGYDADAQGRLVPNAGEQAVIAQVQALRNAGLPLRGIVAELARVGIVSRASTPLQLRQVQVILQRPQVTPACGACSKWPCVCGKRGAK